MKIHVVKFGRQTSNEVTSLAKTYELRLRAFAAVEGREVKSATPKAIASVLESDRIVTLDETGSMWSSEELSAKFKKWIDDPRIKTLTFVIGGPYGLEPEIKSKAHDVWSLSRATFPSDLAWVLAWEQIYRAFNIIKGTSYHHK